MRESYCVCGGVIAWSREKVAVKNRNFGNLEVGRCDRCKSRYLHNKTMDMIEHKLKFREEKKASIYDY